MEIPWPLGWVSEPDVTYGQDGSFIFVFNYCNEEHQIAAGTVDLESGELLDYEILLGLDDVTSDRSLVASLDELGQAVIFVITEDEVSQLKIGDSG